MEIKFNDSKIKMIFKDGFEIDKIMLGEELLWENTPKQQYYLPTEEDFNFDWPSSPRYIGEEKFVRVPEALNGKPLTSMTSMFTSHYGRMIEGVALDNPAVVNMEAAFSGLTSSSLDLSQFKTVGAVNMGFLFSDIYYMEQIDLSTFDVSAVDNMSSMFKGSWFKSLDLTSFKFGVRVSVGYMFYGSHAELLDLSSWDTSYLGYHSEMFTNCKATTGYARTQEDADFFNAVKGKPAALTFVVK